jgi:hypothetical protein
LAHPPARNVQKWSDYCPHCLNAGGPWLVSQQGHGVCGDPVTMPTPRPHETGGKYASPPVLAATYKQGQRFEAHVTLTANHMGRFSLSLCPDANALTDACFETYPLEPKWTRVSADQNEYNVTYTLPPKITCSQCVLRWQYDTGNSCTWSSTDEERGLAPCLSPHAPFPEQFFNCADVAIQGNEGDEENKKVKKISRRQRRRRKKRKQRRINRLPSSS